MKPAPFKAWILLAMLGTVAACGGRDAPPPPTPTPVGTARVGRGSIAEQVVLTGRIAPPVDRDAVLAPRVEGTVLAVKVREGQIVRKGDLLAQIDSAPLSDAVSAAQAAVRRTQADAEFRRREAERTKTLVERGVSSRQDAESDEAAAVAAESAQVEAKAALAEASRKRGWAELRAPFDGVVLRVMKSAGEQVDGTPATAVVEVAATSPLEVAADAPSASLVKIRPGQTAETRVPGSTLPAARARVVRVAAAVSAQAGVGEVRLALVPPAPALPLGTAVEARIDVVQKQDVLVVPAKAVRRSESGTSEVVTVSDGRAKAQPVRTGISSDDRVEVLDGLSEGVEIVVDDPLGLPDGTLLSPRS